MNVIPPPHTKSRGRPIVRGDTFRTRQAVTASACGNALARFHR